MRAWRVSRRSFARLSLPLRGQGKDDAAMGERAAAKTNKMLDKIGGMYVSKNIGYSKSYADSYVKVFGEKDSSSADGEGTGFQEVEFAEGPIGLEIEWRTPPVVVAAVAGSAGEQKNVKAGQVLLQINGRDVTRALPELELDHLMQQRPLRICFGDPSTSSPKSTSSFADLARRLGYAIVPGALSPRRSEELFKFMLAERSQAISECEANPGLISDRFSDVQTPRSGDGKPISRWDMRLPVTPIVYNALQELLGSTSKDSLGAAFEDLAGRQAELWELGVVVSEPGAAPQPVHFDAAEECLFSAFIALQDIAYEMGPTHFIPGTNTKLAHAAFESDPAAFCSSEPPKAALLQAGDAVVYDSRVLHCGGHNVSDRIRALLYLTFRKSDVDPKKMGIDQHSLRASLRGKFRLRHFR